MGRTIDGVQVIHLQQISDERGAVHHMLEATDPHFIRFGEIYFSTIYPGVVKGWKAHRRLIANCATELSDPAELDHLEPTSGKIPYTW